MTLVLKGLLAVGILGVPAFGQTRNDRDAVMKVDEEYRIAKLQNDTVNLNRILTGNFVETNQNGTTRDKAQTIDLWKSFQISTLSTDSIQVRIGGDTAVVTGTQTENGNDRMIFMRVYAKDVSGWRLVSSMQSADIQYLSRKERP
jgi:Domain of unknown function (DUF4440)